MKTDTLTIPRHSDPLARAALPAPPQVLSRAKTPVLRVRARLMPGWIDDA